MTAQKPLLPTPPPPVADIAADIFTDINSEIDPAAALERRANKYGLTIEQDEYGDFIPFYIETGEALTATTTSTVIFHSLAEIEDWLDEVDDQHNIEP